ncbi:MAG: hypothetical protein VKK97_02510 [Synechococcaceae cyanobacterium]|nr:hypothetical protein [Synechococcaceae cyanobacterium]
MPKPTTKTRKEIGSLFVRNAIPTEQDYAALIAAGLNQADDGILKLPDQPLGLVRQMPPASVPPSSGPSTPSTASAPAPSGVLNLFGAPEDESPSWQLQLIGSSNPDFGLADQSGTTRLLLDGTTGNLGIGTSPTTHKLTVAGTLNVAGTFNAAKDPASCLTNAGQLAIKGDSVQLDFIDTDHQTDWAINVNNGKLSFVRSPENNDLVLDGSGNVGIGTITPGQRLSVNGEWNNGRESLSTLDNTGQLAITSKSGGSVQTEPPAQLDFVVPGNDNDWAIQNKNGILTFFHSPWQDFASLSIDKPQKLQYSYATFKAHVIRSVFATCGRIGAFTRDSSGPVTDRALIVRKRHKETVLRILYCDNFQCPIPNTHCRWEVKVAKGVPPAKSDSSAPNTGSSDMRFGSSQSTGIVSCIKDGTVALPGSIMGYIDKLDGNKLEEGYWRVEIHAVPTSGASARPTTGSGTGDGVGGSSYALEVEEVFLNSLNATDQF